MNPGTSEQAHHSRLSAMDDFIEVFSWHETHIWAFKSRYANRCVLSNSIIKPDFTWVRKILFPSFFIFTWRLHFTIDDSPTDCDENRTWGGGSVVSLQGEGAHALPVSAATQFWDHRMLMKGPLFSCLGLHASFPTDVWHAVNLLFFILTLCVCVWHLGKSCSQEFGGTVHHLLADFSFGHRWNKRSGAVLDSFFQIHSILSYSS